MEQKDVRVIILENTRKSLMLLKCRLINLETWDCISYLLIDVEQFIKGIGICLGHLVQTSKSVSSEAVVYCLARKTHPE